MPPHCRVVVRRHYESRGGVSGLGQEEVHYFLGHDRIHGGGRLVREDQGRGVDKGAGDGGALPLADRESGGLLPELVGDTESGGQGGDALAIGRARDLEGQGDVLFDAQEGKQGPRLEDVADVPGAPSVKAFTSRPPGGHDVQGLAARAEAEPRCRRARAAQAFRPAPGRARTPRAGRRPPPSCATP
jgi:hypothetical protein